MNNRSANLALAASFASALTLVSAASHAAESGQEKCYGIALAGQNDCSSSAGNSCSGTSTEDYDKRAWKYVPKGTCEKIEVTLKDGTKRKGSPSEIR